MACWSSSRSPCLPLSGPCSSVSNLLAPDLLAELARMRLRTGQRIEGRYAGSHTSRRYGSSVDFADHRDYVPGDDPRRIDRPAWLRTRKLLVRLHDAEDEATVRIVLDLSASMGFGTKLDLAQQAAAVFVALAGGDQDRVRLLLAGPGGRVNAGPWSRGPGALAASEALLGAHGTDPIEADRPADGQPAVAEAVRRAVGEGGAGPVVVISDLLHDGWEDVLRALGSAGGDRILVHLVGRSDLQPNLDGDFRLVDAETGAEVEVGITDRLLDQYAATVARWLAAVDEQAGRQRAHVVRLVDDEPVRELSTRLRRLGLVAA